MAQGVDRQTTSGGKVIQLAVRLGLLAFLVYWSFVLVRPFIPILAWSMVLTVALYPAYNWLSVHLGDRPKLAAAIITVISLAIIIGPVTWLGYGVIDGVQDFARELDAGALDIPSPPDGVKDWPAVGAPIYELWDQASTNLRAALKEVAPHLKPLAGPVLAFAGSASLGTLKFVASVVLSGFLFHYGPGLVAAIKRIQARLVNQRSQDFVALAGLTIRTIAQGVIGVAVLQALLAGIGLKLAGVPHAGVLALLVLILAILQIGSAIVLVPGRGVGRQYPQTGTHGTWAEYTHACHLHRCPGRNAGAWDSRAVCRSHYPGGDLGIDDGVDPRRAGGYCRIEHGKNRRRCLMFGRIMM
jgi:predicted PurR-regulated permease PerM